MVSSLFFELCSKVLHRFRPYVFHFTFSLYVKKWNYRTKSHSFSSKKPLYVVADAHRLQYHEFGTKMSGVRIPSLRPNKVDSFDTRVSETINLFLFAKMLVLQGFSRFLFFELVSLRMNKHLFSGCGRPE